MDVMSGGRKTVRAYWIRPERNKRFVQDYLDDNTFARNTAVAAECGLDLRVISVDDILVSMVESATIVQVGGETVVPTEVFFHVKLMTFPSYESETWRTISTAELLRSTGFHVSTPLELNVLAGDKLLTLVQLQRRVLDHLGSQLVRCLPTVRVSTRQFYSLPQGALPFPLPVIVKPSSWGGGNAVAVVRTVGALDAQLQIAGAAALTMIVQPWLGQGTSDLRVYCVDGTVQSAWERRPAPSAVVANYGMGGSYAQINLPVDVADAAHAVAQFIGAPYLCIDFLLKDGRYWLSEIEPDGGAVGYLPDLEIARFSALRSGYDRFVSGSEIR